MLMTIFILRLNYRKAYGKDVSPLKEKLLATTLTFVFPLLADCFLRHLFRPSTGVTLSNDNMFSPRGLIF